MAARSPAAGLVPKMCKVKVIDGALRVESDESGKPGFLGTAQVRMKGPLTAKLRLRGKGAGSVRWMTAGQETFPSEGQTVRFNLEGRNGWEDLELKLPIKGTPRLVRLHLPVREGAVDVESITYTDRTGQSKEWDFSEVKAE